MAVHHSESPVNVLHVVQKANFHLQCYFVCRTSTCVYRETPTWHWAFSRRAACVCKNRGICIVYRNFISCFSLPYSLYWYTAYLCIPWGRQSVPISVALTREDTRAPLIIPIGHLHLYCFYPCNQATLCSMAVNE